MKNVPAVTVVIPTYNEERTIGAQLEALERQEEITPAEIIVADNGSSDRTVEVARSYVGRLPQLRCVVADGAPGASHARNVAANMARSELLAFCDGDDEVDDRWLVALTASLRSVDAVTGPLDLDRLNPPRVRRWREVNKVVPEPGQFVRALTGNLGVSTRVFREVGGFDESYQRSGHDYEFSLRLAHLGYTVGYSPDLVVHYRIRDSVGALLKREYEDSIGAAHVYAAYGPDAYPEASIRSAVKHWAWLVLHVGDLLRPKTSVRWLRKAAGALGRLHGSVRHRVVYL